jgi:indoleacetamide hydrolase
MIMTQVVVYRPSGVVAASALMLAMSVLAVLAGCATPGDSAAGLAAQAAAVRAGTTRSEALVREAIAKARANTQLNAFITLDETGAIAAAREVDNRRRMGGSLEPLAGVPIVVKDNIHVAGMPNSAGTPGLADFVPKEDAPVVAALRKAGAIVIGKTNMHELAFGISGYNEAFKTQAEFGVRNAVDPKRAAGGSSSGTGAAVGAGIVLAGLGTDTGGSVRIPCAFNGCAALRPTVKRYSQEGIAPISSTRDTAGPMAASMRDVALLDSVITGTPVAAAADLKSVRFGIVKKPFLDHLDEDTRAVFDSAIAKLRAAGATIVDVDMPNLAALNGAVGFPVALYEGYDDLATYLKKWVPGMTVEMVAQKIASKDVKGTFDGLVVPRKLPGPNNTLMDAKPVYEAAIRTERPKLVALYAQTFSANKLDAIIFPTTPRVAMLQGPSASSPENFGLYIQNTDPGSNAGVPGISVPAGRGKVSGLPVGIELDGPANSDARLIAIGIAVEQALR